MVSAMGSVEEEDEEDEEPDEVTKYWNKFLTRPTRSKWSTELRVLARKARAKMLEEGKQGNVPGTQTVPATTSDWWKAAIATTRYREGQKRRNMGYATLMVVLEDVSVSPLDDNLAFDKKQLRKAVLDVRTDQQLDWKKAFAYVYGTEWWRLWGGWVAKKEHGRAGKEYAERNTGGEVPVSTDCTDSAAMGRPTRPSSVSGAQETSTSGTYAEPIASQWSPQLRVLARKAKAKMLAEGQKGNVPGTQGVPPGTIKDWWEVGIATTVYLKGQKRRNMGYATLLVVLEDISATPLDPGLDFDKKQLRKAVLDVRTDEQIDWKEAFAYVYGSEWWRPWAGWVAKREHGKARPRKDAERNSGGEVPISGNSFASSFTCSAKLQFGTLCGCRISLDVVK